MSEQLFDKIESKTGLFFPVTPDNEVVQGLVTGLARIYSGEGIWRTSGTGFVFEENDKRFLISALHCFGEDMLQPARVVFPWGQVQASPDELLRFSYDGILLDIAALPLDKNSEAHKTHAFKRAAPTLSLEEEPLLALGYPSAYLRYKGLEGPVYSVGRSQGMIEEWSRRFTVQLRAETGMSGSPLLDHHLDVVGVTVARLSTGVPSFLGAIFASQRRASSNHTYGVLLPSEVVSATQ